MTRSNSPKPLRFILLLLPCLFVANLSTAQVVYDTIPKVQRWLTTHLTADYPVFVDIESQSADYFNHIDFKDIDCDGERVDVSAIFSKDRTMDQVKIITAASPMCDSIAYYFVKGLEGWIPALEGGKFVDAPFNFPFVFDSLKVLKMFGAAHSFLSVSDEEFRKRSTYFDFVHTDDPNHAIIGDYQLFQGFIAEALRTEKYIHILSNYKRGRKESVALEIEVPNPKSTHVLIWNPAKNWILDAYDLRRRKKIRIAKDKELFLVVFEEGKEPLIQTQTFRSSTDEKLAIFPVQYNRGQLLEELAPWRK